jgi:hypothetical protein
MGDLQGHYIKGIIGEDGEMKNLSKNKLIFLCLVLLMIQSGCASKSKQSTSSVSTVMSKEQCVTKFAARIGQVAARQECVNESARQGLDKFDAIDRIIIEDCANLLVDLARRADSRAISLDAYKVQKQQIRMQCNTAIRTKTPINLPPQKVSDDFVLKDIPMQCEKLGFSTGTKDYSQCVTELSEN